MPELLARGGERARKEGSQLTRTRLAMQESEHGRVAPTHGPPPGALGETAGPHALQILTTEHWSLLSARSLGYTESMSRASIFVAGLTGSVVALALVGQATAFGGGFTAFALVLLTVVFFLGCVTIARLAQITWEDANWMQGMNRLRNAYHEFAPEIEPYFVTSRYDDEEGVHVSSHAVPSLIPRLQVFVAMPGVIAVLDSVVAGAIAAIAALALGAGTAATVGIGIAIFVLTLAAFMAMGAWLVSLVRRNVVIRFPTPGDLSGRNTLVQPRG